MDRSILSLSYKFGTAVMDTPNSPYPEEKMEDAHSLLKACYGCSRLKSLFFFQNSERIHF